MQSIAPSCPFKLFLTFLQPHESCVWLAESIPVISYEIIFGALTAIARLLV